MENAFLTAFDEGARRAVLIGSDLPDLPAGLISGSLESLREHNAVIGPAADGVGMSALGPRSQAGP